MLESEPLVIYGSLEIPDGAVPICSVDRCVAKGIFTAAENKETPALYIGKDSLKGCCPGAMS